MPPQAVDAPDDLSAEQQRFWDALAPHARAAGTLTPGTARAFRELCEWLAVKQAIYDDPKERGGTKYRGMAALIAGGLARFRLNADGKPMTLPEAPKDEWAEFDAGPHLVKGARG